MKILNIYQESELLIFEFDQTLDNIKNVYIKNEFDEIMVPQSNIKNQFKINLNEVLEKFSQYDRETIFILLEQSDGITQSIQKINIKNMNIIFKTSKQSLMVKRLLPRILLKMALFNLH